MVDSRWKPTWLIKASMVLHAAVAVFLIAQPASWRIALLIIIADHLLLAVLGLWPRSQMVGPTWTRLPEEARSRNEIALTFDDGPDPLVTPKILDTLDRYSAKATFFCIGEKAARYPDLCRDITRRGHAVENHSQRHLVHFALLGPAGLARELRNAQDTLRQLTGQQPGFFRAPAGLRSPLLDPVLARQGLLLASWSVRGFDTLTSNADRVYHRLHRGLKAGAILLLHDGNSALTSDGGPVVLEVLPRILASARDAGLHCTTLRAALNPGAVT